MNVTRVALVAVTCLLATSLFAQPQIGGGTCSSATLSGTYSLTFSGRDLPSQAVVAASQSIGTATFDGLSKVIFSVTTNTSTGAGLAAGISQTLSGTYSLQANCVGALNINSGDTASFTLISYNQGKDYLITGQDGIYSLTGSGSTLPATCPATFSGTYAFNGNGFALNAGAVSGVNYLSGLITLTAPATVTTTWYVTGISTPVSTTGTYTLSAGCAATAKITDPSGNTYSLIFTLTTASGGNFIFNAASPKMIFTGTGRTL